MSKVNIKVVRTEDITPDEYRNGLSFIRKEDTSLYYSIETNVEHILPNNIDILVILTNGNSTYCNVERIRNLLIKAKNKVIPTFILYKRKSDDTYNYYLIDKDSTDLRFGMLSNGYFNSLKEEIFLNKIKQTPLTPSETFLCKTYDSGYKKSNIVKSLLIRRRRK